MGDSIDVAVEIATLPDDGVRIAVGTKIGRLIELGQFRFQVSSSASVRAIFIKSIMVLLVLILCSFSKIFGLARSRLYPEADLYDG